ncbi:MAG: glycosyltransferase [Prevotella sp.]|nr:glycosyltransferase [Prevotella sp.]
MESTLVTVITISYNSGKTIRRTIESVLSQTYPNIEYIVIDGQSTDDTISIIKQYGNKISSWVSEPDKGIYDAMNKGLRAAHGTIISILNSDDAFHSSTSVQEVVDFYQHTPKECIIHGNIEYHEQGKQPFILRPLPHISTIKKEPAVLHPTMFVPKAVYDRSGVFSLDYRIAADYELMLRFFTSGVKYQYMNVCIVDMYSGGASDKKKYHGFIECYHISVKYGRGRVCALITLAKRFTKSWVYSLKQHII